MSLCFAESKEKLALAYGNRSAVYFELKKYDECLKNIKWARENGYPLDNIQKLDEREEKCKNFKVANPYNAENDPFDFFKLSHEPHPKIPFIADCLEVREIKTGKALYSTRDLKPGDIICIEESCFRQQINVKYNQCFNCLSVNMMNLIPCEKSNTIMFCSEKCRDNMYQIHGDDIKDMSPNGEVNIERYVKEVYAAFGGEDNFIKFLRGNSLTNLKFTYFDFDRSDKNHPEYKANLIKCFLSMRSIHPTNNICMKLISEIPKKRSVALNYKHKPEIMNFVQYVEPLVDKYNASKTNDSRVYSCFDLLKHSCMPNVEIEQFDNKDVIFVTRSIPAGKQLFRNYLSIHYYYTSSKLRKRMIKIGCIEKCSCFACKHGCEPNHFVVKDQSIIDNAKLAEHKASQVNGGSVKALRKAIKKNWEYLSANKDWRSVEVPELIRCNVRMTGILGAMASFPCAR